MTNVHSKAGRFADIATGESFALQGSIEVVLASYDEIENPSAASLGRLAVIGLELPADPIHLDPKKYYELPADAEPLEELERTWHGYKSYWVPNLRNYETTRDKVHFQRFKAVLPELVGLIDTRVTELGLGAHDLPDRLSIAIPLAASLDLLSHRFISPSDPGALLPDGSPRHNLLF
jgi:hypothetical protein